MIEGVHIVPSDRLLRAWREGGGIAVGLLMQVESEEKHRQMLKSRDAHSYEELIDILQALIGFVVSKKVFRSEQRLPHGLLLTFMGK